MYISYSTKVPVNNTPTFYFSKLDSNQKNCFTMNATLQLHSLNNMYIYMFLFLFFLMHRRLRISDVWICMTCMRLLLPQSGSEGI